MILQLSLLDICSQVKKAYIYTYIYIYIHIYIYIYIHIYIYIDCMFFLQLKGTAMGSLRTYLCKSYNGLSRNSSLFRH